MTWKHISECLPDIKNLNKTSNLDRMDEMRIDNQGVGNSILTQKELKRAAKYHNEQGGWLSQYRYPTLSEVMDAVKKRDADILALTNHVDFLVKRINGLASRVAELESPKQFEKIGGE